MENGIFDDHMRNFHVIRMLPNIFVLHKTNLFSSSPFITFLYSPFLDIWYTFSFSFWDFIFLNLYLIYTTLFSFKIRILDHFFAFFNFYVSTFIGIWHLTLFLVFVWFYFTLFKTSHVCSFFHCSWCHTNFSFPTASW